MIRPIPRMFSLGAIAVFSSMFFGAAAKADSITFTGSGFNGGQAISASVTFTTDGLGGLTVTLTNTQTISGTVDPASVLTGVFYNMAGNPSLTKVSAFIGSSSHIFDAASAISPFNTASPIPGTIGGNGNVGSEWGYGNGTSTTATTRNQVIASAGFTNMTFASNAFDNNVADNLAGPPSGSFDGAQYGILGSDPAGVVGGGNNVPQVVDTIVFNFTGLDPNFNLQTGITDLFFQYGTSLTEASFDGHPHTSVPEPSSIALGAVGLIGLGFARIRSLLRRKALALA